MKQPKDYSDDDLFCQDYEGHGSGIGFIVLMSAIAGALAFAAFLAW